MDTQTAARLLAVGRIGIGAALLAAPERIITPWIGSAGSTPGGRLLGNVIGIRDLVVGAGQLAALTSGKGARPWLIAGAACDFVDLAATLRHRSDLPPLGVVGTSLLAATGAAGGAWLQSAVD